MSNGSLTDGIIMDRIVTLTCDLFTMCTPDKSVFKSHHESKRSGQHNRSESRIGSAKVSGAFDSSKDEGVSSDISDVIDLDVSDPTANYGDTESGSLEKNGKIGKSAFVPRKRHQTPETQLNFNRKKANRTQRSFNGTKKEVIDYYRPIERIPLLVVDSSTSSPFFDSDSCNNSEQRVDIEESSLLRTLSRESFIEGSHIMEGRIQESHTMVSRIQESHTMVSLILEGSHAMDTPHICIDPPLVDLAFGKDVSHYLNEIDTKSSDVKDESSNLNAKFSSDVNDKPIDVNDKPIDAEDFLDNMNEDSDRINDDSDNFDLILLCEISPVGPTGKPILFKAAQVTGDREFIAEDADLRVRDVSESVDLTDTARPTASSQIGILGTNLPSLFAPTIGIMPVVPSFLSETTPSTISMLIPDFSQAITRPVPMKISVAKNLRRISMPVFSFPTECASLNGDLTAPAGLTIQPIQLRENPSKENPINAKNCKNSPLDPGNCLINTRSDVGNRGISSTDSTSNVRNPISNPLPLNRDWKAPITLALKNEAPATTPSAKNMSSMIRRAVYGPFVNQMPPKNWTLFSNNMKRIRACRSRSMSLSKLPTLLEDSVYYEEEVKE